MKRCLLLIFSFLFFALHAADALTTPPSLSLLKSVDCEQDSACEHYSLRDLLGHVSKNYGPSLQEAIAAIAPNEEIDNIYFRPLLGGLSKSKLFVVNVKGRKYVVRLLDENKAVERRRSEVNAHQIGEGLKIAPKLLYIDNIPLVMVMEYIEGRTFSSDDLSDHEVVSKVMQTIKKFHSYSGEEHLRKKTKFAMIQDVYDRYTKKGAVYPSCFDRIYRQLQEDFVSYDREYRPSHGDFNPRNILITKEGDIYLIDWAEASFDSPYLDIAWLSCFSAASNDQMKHLLREYLGKDPTAAEMEELLFYKDVTTFFVATLWIGRQEERDQGRLDALLQGPLKMSSEYIIDGITPDEISKKKELDLTVYSLGWLKDLIQLRGR